MLLKNKNAVIYGGGASLAGAVARTMAREGANIFLAGRNIASLQKVKEEIIQNGGRAEAAAVDALDENLVRQHLQKVVDSTGSVDISFNLIGINAVQNIPLIEMTLPEFVQTITEIMTTQFLTCTAAGQLMVRQGSGVILSLTATPGGIGGADGEHLQAADHERTATHRGCPSSGSRKRRTSSRLSFRT